MLPYWLKRTLEILQIPFVIMIIIYDLYFSGKFPKNKSKYDRF